VIQHEAKCRFPLAYLLTSLQPHSPISVKQDKPGLILSRRSECVSGRSLTVGAVILEMHAAVLGSDFYLHSRLPSSSCMRCLSVGGFGALLSARARSFAGYISLRLSGNPCRSPTWPCPLTLLEDWLERRAESSRTRADSCSLSGQACLSDISANVLTTAAVIVCLSNLAFYARLMWISRHAHS